MMLDLDYFKEVNDTLGHDAGDDLLKQASARMRECVRNSDTVARVGGDEFVILLDGPIDEDIPRHIAQRLNEELARPFVVQGRKAEISASIGVALALSTDVTEDSIRKQADIALYEAKGQGRNRTIIHA